MIGDPLTAQRLQAMNQALQGTRDPSVAQALQEAMANQQMQGARNLVYAANANRQGLDPTTGINPGDMARQFAQQNLQNMQQQRTPNILNIQQARNNLMSPLNALGVPGMMPRGGMGSLQSALLGLPTTSGAQQGSIVGSNQ